MSEAGDILKHLDEHEPPGLPAIALMMQQMCSEGYIKGYSIGGSVAIVFYSEPFDTEDVDVFCYYSDKLATDISPIRKRLEELGVVCRGIYCYISNIKVQMQSMAKATPLEKEAFETSIAVDVEGVLVRIFQLEYAMAVKVQANRDQDWNHITTAIRSADPDMDKFRNILKKHNLLDVWRKHEHR